MKNKRSALWVPFALTAAVGLVYHLLMQPMGGDDVFFREATEGTTLWAYLAGRYQNWTSRVVSEFVLVSVMQCLPLWRLIDFLMFASLPLILSRYFDRSRLICWCAAGAALLFPFHDMGTAGWATTTVTHFWPFWCIFFVGMLVKKILSGEKIFWWELLIGIPACIITGSHEQMAVILLFVLVMSTVSLYWEKKRGEDAGGRKYGGNAGEKKRGGKGDHGGSAEAKKLTGHAMMTFVAFWVIDVISLAVIALCPGNAKRNAVSIADLPVYAEFNFGEKLYLGLLSIERVFLANADVVFFAVALIWALLVYVKTKDFKKTLVSSVPLLILFGQTVLRTAYPGLSGLFVMPGQILSWSWGELSTWIPMVYLAAAVASMLYALWQLFGESVGEYVCVLILLGLGFGAGAVLGFMATIYVSGERVYAPLYGILLLVTMAAIEKQRGIVELRVKTTAGKLIVTLLGLLCFVNVFFITLSV